MSKKLTHEEFVEKLLRKNKHYADGDFVLIGQYTGSNNPIECHCNIHNTEWKPLPVELCRNKGCPDCGRESSVKNRTLSYEQYNEKLNKSRPGFIVVGPYIDELTPTNFQCKNGHIFTNTPAGVLHSHGGCPYCKGRKILIGYNDMWTTRPNIAAMLTNPEDGYKYTAGSNKKTWFNCPDCGVPSLKIINNVATHNFGCQHCSDNISYPNKFSRALLDQLPIDSYDCEYQPEWAKPYYYDNHFLYNGVEYFLEMDGHLHYNAQTFSRTTLEKIQETDRIKNELALRHNVCIIRINCEKSDVEYIKTNILNSGLSNVFDLSNIDWQLCDKKAQKNILKEACELYMSKLYTLVDIGKMLHVHPTTVSHYLQKGSRFGWCDYIPQKEKPVAIIDDNNHVVHLFASIAECGREMKQSHNTPFYPEGIRNSCQTHKPYKGFNFRFANETTQN